MDSSSRHRDLDGVAVTADRHPHRRGVPLDARPHGSCPVNGDVPEIRIVSDAPAQPIAKSKSESPVGTQRSTRVWRDVRHGSRSRPTVSVADLGQRAVRQRSHIRPLGTEDPSNCLPLERRLGHCPPRGRSTPGPRRHTDLRRPPTLQCAATGEEVAMNPDDVSQAARTPNGQGATAADPAGGTPAVSCPHDGRTVRRRAPLRSAEDPLGAPPMPGR